MKTYSSRVSVGPVPGSGSASAARQPAALQHAIDGGARMLAQRQQVHALRQPAIVQAKPKWLKTLLHTTKETTTAHSPGIYTGPVSTVNYGALGNNVAHYQAIKDSGFATYPTASTNMGYATVGASSVGDVVGGFFSIKTMAQNGPLGKDTSWHSADYATRKEARAAFKSATADLTGQTLDVGSQISSTLSGVSQAGTVATQVAPFGAGVVNLGVGIRAAISAGRAGTYRRRLKALKKSGQEWEFLNSANGQEAPQQAPLQEQVEFAQNQMKKREVRQGIGAFGAALGTGGAIALGVAGLGLGAVALATPIGWGLAAAGAAVALGVGAYKAYKYIKKRRKDKLGTERDYHATAIMDALHAGLGREPQDDQQAQNNLARRTYAKELLKARGVNANKLLAANKEKGIKHVARKLKSW